VPGVSKSTKRKRTVLLQSWLTPEEAATVRAMASDAGVEVSVLLRTAVLGYRLPRSRTQTEALVRLSGQLGNLTSNVNQIAYLWNVLQNPPSPGLVDATEAALREILEWRGPVMRGLGAERDRKRVKDESAPKDHQ
jgi:hypothetical protein